MFKSFATLIASAALALGMASCSTAPKSEQGKADIIRDADAAIRTAQANDSSLKTVMNNAAGYAVFPSVGKGGVGVGGAYGKGVLYEAGRPVGYCDLSQGSIGLQLGGQTYTEIICFENAAALNRFKQGNLEFGAQATAVAVESGSGANAKYRDGVSVFTMGETGLMYEASVGGQGFEYEDM